MRLIAMPRTVGAQGVIYPHQQCVCPGFLIWLCHDETLLQIASFTSSSGPLSYTSLIPSSYAHARSLADASILLPYLAGSAPSLARRYSDRLLTTTSIHALGMACVLAGVCLLGLVSGLWVPRLPLEIPRRGTGVFSWVVAFGFGLKTRGGEGELMLEDDLGVGGGYKKGMELQELKESLGEARLRWVAG
jgi:hypothetical protein